MGVNNRVANRYRRNGLISLAALLVFALLVASVEAIHSRISVPAHHQRMVELLETQKDLQQARQEIGAINTKLDQVTIWALCLQDAKVTAPPPKTKDFQDERARCNDPR
jgi:hypothetical protein